jgi:hypothetical protein
MGGKSGGIHQPIFAGQSSQFSKLGATNFKLWQTDPATSVAVNTYYDAVPDSKVPPLSVGAHRRNCGLREEFDGLLAGQ